KFPSPDGKFALLIDKKGKPAIIGRKSRQRVLELQAFREDEDKMIWSSASKRMAYCHRGNKTTETRAFFWDGSTFNEIALPELPEIELKFKTSNDSHVHFDHDNV